MKIRKSHIIITKNKSYLFYIEECKYGKGDGLQGINNFFIELNQNEKRKEVF